MLVNCIGRKEDVAARNQRGHHAFGKTRKWFWGTPLSRRTRVLIVQAVVEATLLFDCNTRPWAKNETKKTQGMVDQCYRRIWCNGRSQPFRLMEKGGVNAYSVRRTLGIDSIRLKIEKRTLGRIGHIMRMSNERLVKIVVLGQWNKEASPDGGLRGGSISYWRRISSEAGEDKQNIEQLTRDRKNYKKTTERRIREIRNWELKMSQKKRDGKKPERAHIRTERGEFFICR